MRYVFFYGHLLQLHPWRLLPFGRTPFLHDLFLLVLCNTTSILTSLTCYMYTQEPRLMSFVNVFLNRDFMMQPSSYTASLLVLPSYVCYLNGAAVDKDEVVVVFSEILTLGKHFKRKMPYVYQANLFLFLWSLLQCIFRLTFA